MTPQNGLFKDFDFDLIYDEKFVGVSSNNLGYQGTGKYNGAWFNFSGPVNEFTFRYAVGFQSNPSRDYYEHL